VFEPLSSRSTGASVPATVASVPPDNGCRYDDDANTDRDARDPMVGRVPDRGKAVAHEDRGRRERDGSQRVEWKKFAISHSRHASDKWRDRACKRKEARSGHGNAAMFLKEALDSFDVRSLEAEVSAKPDEPVSPQASPHLEPQVVSKGCGPSNDREHDPQREIAAGGEEAPEDG
jgi:hypothetical protein